MSYLWRVKVKIEPLSLLSARDSFRLGAVNRFSAVNHLLAPQISLNFDDNCFFLIKSGIKFVVLALSSNFRNWMASPTFACGGRHLSRLFEQRRSTFEQIVHHKIKTKLSTQLFLFIYLNIVVTRSLKLERIKLEHGASMHASRNRWEASSRFGKTSKDQSGKQIAGEPEAASSVTRRAEEFDWTEPTKR